MIYMQNFVLENCDVKLFLYLVVLTKLPKKETIFYWTFFLVILLEVVIARDEYVGRVFFRTESGLTDVPSDIPSEAVEVHLHNNQITHLRNGGMSHLTTCAFLSFQTNLISTIDQDAFLGMSNLANLHLSYNRLTVLKKGMFNGLSSLDELNLNSNDIDTIEPGCFSNLNNLNYPYISSNDLTSVSGSIWQGLQSLTWLYLYVNNIAELKAGDFSNLPHLERLYLYGNRFTTIDHNVFDPHDHPNSDGHPRKLRLSFGAMQCDSRLCWLKQGEQLGWITWLDTRGVRYHPNCVNHLSSWDEVDLRCSDNGAILLTTLFSE